MRLATANPVRATSRVEKRSAARAGAKYVRARAANNRRVSELGP